METATRPSGWPARSERRVALTGTIAGLAERLGAPADFLRALVIAAAFAEPWVWAAYVLVAVALAAPGERRPGLGSVVVAGRMAALIGVVWLATLPGGTTTMLDLEGKPSSWIPFSAITAAALTALLVRRRPGGFQPTARDTVLAVAPFVLAAAGFALAVVLVPDVRWERWLFLAPLIAGVALLVRPRAALARAAIAPAGALAGVSALVIGAGVRLEGGVGDIALRPHSATEVPRELRRGVGDIELDLAGLRGEEGPTRLALDASVGVGSIDVEVPRRTLVEVDAGVSKGRLFVHSDDQRDARVTARAVPIGETGRPVKPRMRLRLRLRAGVGEVIVNEGSGSTRWKL
ncbi:MAG: hypothetical protein M3131_05565 [Actinomycetota bacterium]|nr:hypothetical protein [Actinomycetota bacterium]